MRDDEAPAGEETGYYEVALSNRQLVGAFCLFSVVLAGAFLMGVWFAREGQALGPARPAAPRAAEEVSAAADLDPGTAGALEEMKFFSEEERRPVPAPTRPAPPASLQTAPSPSPTPAAPPIVTPAAPKPPAPSTSPPAVAAGNLHVQVFSSPDQGQARRVLDQLRKAGYNAALSPIDVGNRTMHRVRVGPFAERSEAERVAAQVKSKFNLATWITSY